MGAGSSGVDPAEFETLKNKVSSIDSSISSLNALKTQVSDVSKAAASAIKYDDLALAITNNDTNKNALATAIASNPNKLGDSIASSIGSNTQVIQSLQDKLGSNTTFQTAMADTLSSDKYKVKFQGPKGADGNIGDAGALKSNLFDQGRTMWCADGDVCYVPDNKNWVRHPGPNLVLGGKQDKNRWIIHTPNDDRKGMWIAPGNGTDNWDWGKALNILSNGDIQGGGTMRVGGDNNSFKAIMTSGWDGGSVRSKGTIGIVNDANNTWLAVMDGDSGGRLLVKNRVQIGDWIFYQRPDGHLALHNNGDRYIFRKDYPNGFAVNTGRSYRIGSGRWGNLRNTPDNRIWADGGGNGVEESWKLWDDANVQW
uniref:Uncharacterized protein n=1 Tax=viral metagenome TaxID=1070528 RepID=A0A6C0H6Y9_9ZZZZ